MTAIFWGLPLLWAALYHTCITLQTLVPLFAALCAGGVSHLSNQAFMPCYTLTTKITSEWPHFIPTAAVLGMAVLEALEPRLGMSLCERAESGSTPLESSVECQVATAPDCQSWALMTTHRQCTMCHMGNVQWALYICSGAEHMATAYIRVRKVIVKHGDRPRSPFAVSRQAKDANGT